MAAKILCKQTLQERRHEGSYRYCFIAKLVMALVLIEIRWMGKPCSLKELGDAIGQALVKEMKG